MTLRRSCFVLLLAAITSAAQGKSSDLPYCGFSAQIDGDSGEWSPPWLDAAIVETAGSPLQRNQVRIRGCWDLDGLLLTAEIRDNDQVAAPLILDLDRFHQYDSMQVYVDARGDAGPRMNDDDVDLLLLPDGRFGALRGDSLIGALAGAAVPQRQAAPLLVDYAVRSIAGGWQFELRIPFAGLGVAPADGIVLGMDLAINDWLVDHPPGNSEALTPERVRALAERQQRLPQPDAAVGTQLLPRTWNGDDDFGYPERWRRLRLTGAPGAWEVLRRSMGSGALAAFGLLGLTLGLACAAGVHLWHRRRLRELLGRMARMAAEPQASAPVATSASDAPAEPPASAADVAADVDVGAGDPRDREFAERVLAHVRKHLQSTLTPAELAAQFHVSVRTLQRRLKAGLDTSPQDLVLAARLEAARELLRQGRWRVGEVAAQVGFEDLSHFSRRYRQAYGHAPSAET